MTVPSVDCFDVREEKIYVHKTQVFSSMHNLSERTYNDGLIYLFLFTDDKQSPLIDDGWLKKNEKP